MGERFSAVELVQSLPDLFTEPRVVVEVAFDELLDVLLRAAIVFGGYAGQLGLELGIEVHIHESIVWAGVARVKRVQSAFARRFVKGKLTYL